jgi:hypothetical protein
MPQIHPTTGSTKGVKGEAVVHYCEPLTTPKMGHHRLSAGLDFFEQAQYPVKVVITVEFNFKRTLLPLLFDLYPGAEAAGKIFR